MKLNLHWVLTIMFICTAALNAQLRIDLYPNGPAESNGFTETEIRSRPDFVTKISNPRMYYYAVENSSKPVPAVLICPGGGYTGVSVVKEGEEIARWFNQRNIAAFILYYRMPNNHPMIPLTDAQTAISFIRKNAKKWKIDPHQTGIMGFSAGGHLAATAGTHFTSPTNRPDFMILCYPVISMQEKLTHGGSRLNLLGKNPDSTLIRKFSNELIVTKNTPPAFIIHAEDDGTVPVNNSINMANALKEKGVPVEIHLFKIGGHGFGMRPVDAETDRWPEYMYQWLNNLNKKK